jgi:ABC-type glycerol-3-phosphate transport system substrate-binding protein
MRRSLFWVLCGVLCLVLPIQGQEATPEATEQAAPPQELTIWWPDALISPENDEALDLLQEQTEAFAETQENTEVVLRLKRVGTTGGIMSTLRTASVVAPGALPTITLVRRQDLVSLVRSGLAQLLEGAVASSTVSNLGNALPLGQVGGELYGIPYMLTFRHLVYRPQDGVDYDGWSYSDLLARGQGFVFPAAQSTGISDVLLLQYLAAGGSLDRDGVLLLDEEALETTLEFYEAASDAALVTGFTLNYLEQEDYLADFRTGEIDTAVFTSDEYMQLLGVDSDLRIAPIPTPTGEQAAILNGWVWVMLSSMSEQQTLALRYIDWMMEPERQAALAREAFTIPSQTSALQEPLARDVASEPYLNFLENPYISLREAEIGSLGQLIQEAAASVLTLERTAEQATEYVLERAE